VFTSSYAHLLIVLSSSPSCVCRSRLPPPIPFSTICPLIPSAQVSLGLPRFLLPGGRRFITYFANLPPYILVFKLEESKINVLLTVHSVYACNEMCIQMFTYEHTGFTNTFLQI
jgi:hypothetical protein